MKNKVNYNENKDTHILLKVSQQQQSQQELKQQW